MPQFQSYMGIDYSGAKTAESSLKGIRVFACQRDGNPLEIHPPSSALTYWTRRGLAQWLSDQILSGPPTLVGIDHGFSFPIDYFAKYGLAEGWNSFLNDFQHHWPTDSANVFVDAIRSGLIGNGAARKGDAKWLRLTEKWTSSASSVFRFNVQGSVGKSTHAGLPWLRSIRKTVVDKCHFWPFDGWAVPPGKSCVAEVYPSLFSKRFPREARDGHQQDAFAVAKWLHQADEMGWLTQFLSPQMREEQRRIAEIEGWILGVL